VSLTEAHQMVPEQSTSAIVLHHPERHLLHRARPERRRGLSSPRLGAGGGGTLNEAIRGRARFVDHQGKRIYLIDASG